MRELLTTGWKMLVVRGVIGIVFGILAIVWPLETAVALALLWGFWALMDGVGLLAQAFQPEGQGSRVWLVLMGVIALVAAFFAIFSPAVTAKALTWILGIWLIVRGLFEVVGAFGSNRTRPRGLLLLSAALSILLGILFVANPGAAAVGIAVFLGVVALMWGAVFVLGGLALRRELTAGETSSAAPSGPA
ncbi:HdeD family acid-resistance protein [Kribbella sp. NPDC049174]|uniref:HdeD family acid-resistance protein n=1 Tax=Kribbella sp. NPDC049174 TaxID=3364112 RepID=UPI003716AB82